MTLRLNVREREYTAISIIIIIDSIREMYAETGLGWRKRPPDSMTDWLTRALTEVKHGNEFPHSEI